MKKWTALLACSAAALLAATPGTARHDAKQRPVLRVTSSEPVTVTGLRFVARERVRVSLHADSQVHSRRVRATRRGSFTVTFSAATVDRCLGFIVNAVGDRGSRAGLKYAQPLCPPPLHP
jgi:hypothetical protein